MSAPIDSRWRWLRLTLAGVIGVSTVGAAGAQDPLVLRDDLQHELRLERPPSRLITLLPSLTETVCALGECARIVATDRYSNWPDAVRALPKAGGLDDPQIELMVRLRPELVLLAYSPRVTERLRDLGVPTFDIEAQSYADIARSVTTLGRLLGVPERAAELNMRIERSVATVVEAAHRSLGSRSPRVYFEVDPGPYGAGPTSFIGEMLHRLGARNVLGVELGPFPRLNPEYVVSENPDVIFISPREAPELAQRPGWARIRAVREGRLCTIAGNRRDTLSRPGPRVAEGLQTMADCLSRLAP